MLGVLPSARHAAGPRFLLASTPGKETWCHRRGWAVEPPPDLGVRTGGKAALRWGSRAQDGVRGPFCPHPSIIAPQ